MEPTPSKCYFVADRADQPTTVGFTNTIITGYLQKYDADWPDDSRLYYAELSLRRVIDWQIEFERALLSHLDSAVPVAPKHMDPREYAFCRQDQQVLRISGQEPAKAAANLEANVANVLFHASVVVDHVCDLTIRMYGAEGTGLIWPQVAQCAKVEHVLDRFAAVRKALGMAYMRDELREAAEDPNPEKLESGVQNELARLKTWRDQRAHRLHYYLTIQGDPIDLLYSSSLNELRKGPGEIRFTHSELAESINRLFRVLDWWCWHSED